MMDYTQLELSNGRLAWCTAYEGKISVSIPKLGVQIYDIPQGLENGVYNRLVYGKDYSGTINLVAIAEICLKESSFNFLDRCLRIFIDTVILSGDMIESDKTATTNKMDCSGIEPSESSQKLKTDRLLRKIEGLIPSRNEEDGAGDLYEYVENLRRKHSSDDDHKSIEKYIRRKLRKQCFAYLWPKFIQPFLTWLTLLGGVILKALSMK